MDGPKRIIPQIQIENYLFSKVLAIGIFDNSRSFLVVLSTIILNISRASEINWSRFLQIPKKGVLKHNQNYPIFFLQIRSNISVTLIPSMAKELKKTRKDVQDLGFEETDNPTGILAINSLEVLTNVGVTLGYNVKLIVIKTKTIQIWLVLTHWKNMSKIF